MVRARIRGLAAGVVAALVVGSGLVAAAVPARASERSVTVDPAEGLGNEVVRVSWTGFNPTEEDGRFGVLVQQCRLAPTSLADCFLGQPYPAVEEGTRQVARTGPEGSGSALFEVRPAANLPVLACSAASPCSILVYENDGVPFADDELPASAVVVEVRFAAAQADCPAVTDFDVRADGEASGTGPFYRWAADLCAGDDPLVLDYTETSSNSGRENFLSGLVDVGLTSLPATDEELEAHPEHPDFAYAPLGLTALVAVVNMRDPFTGERIEEMVLSPRLVARLITNTDIAAILADGELRTLNPGIRFPSIAIARPLLRAERNADTRLVTEWIAGSEAAQRFLAGDDEYGVRVNSAYSEYSYPRDVFENVAQDPEFVPRTGQRTVALRVFYGVKPNGASPDNTEEIGFIGLVDLPTARRFGLPVARIVNPAGEPVAPTDEAIQAGFRAMERTPEGTLAADPNAADPAAYPLVKVDYAMVPTAPEGELRRDLSRFLRYAVDEGQESLPPGHLPLPESLRKETRRLADAMDRASATTTTTTPTTVPVDDPVPVVAPAPPVSGSGYTTVGSGGAVDPVAAPTSAPAVGERVVTTKVVLASASGGRLLPALLVVGVLAVIGFVVTSGVPVRVRRRLRGPSA